MSEKKNCAIKYNIFLVGVEEISLPPLGLEMSKKEGSDGQHYTQPRRIESSGSVARRRFMAEGPKSWS